MFFLLLLLSIEDKDNDDDEDEEEGSGKNVCDVRLHYNSHTRKHTVINAIKYYTDKLMRLVGTFSFKKQNFKKNSTFN
ncbi:hypothetical protein DERP_014420 [Dermatophagoides pteronyssinus]|uniref:Uncharacterized protein n=1 Tax=Dermatophagoides pteronyssinus TaxID=6956 RepID=A0ABQ8IVT8_DERPT|nr:hypothetical protein DERP_014420 [Dermatophagoides pteronyssinus]